MPDWLKLVLEYVPIATAIYALGRYSTKLETLRDDVTKIAAGFERTVGKFEKQLEKLHEHDVEIGTIKEAVTRHRSDFKELRTELRETHGLAVRASALSSHDFNEE